MLYDNAKTKRLNAAAEYREKVKSGEIIRTKSLNPEEKAKQNPTSMKYAIRAKCWDCACGQKEEIKLCPITDCSLYNFRPYKLSDVIV
jgi:hypothetical protein